MSSTRFLFLYYRSQCCLLADCKRPVSIPVTNQNDSCSYELFFSQWQTPPTPKMFTLHPESPCISDLSQMIIPDSDTGQVLHSATFCCECLCFYILLYRLTIYRFSFSDWMTAISNTVSIQQLHSFNIIIISISVIITELISLVISWKIVMAPFKVSGPGVARTL